MSEDFVGEEGVAVGISDSKVVEQLTKELSDRCVGFSCNDDSEALKSLVCCAVQSVEGLSGRATNSIVFRLRFVKRSLICLGGQISDPLSRRGFSLPFLPATPSSQSRTLEGLFELTRRPSLALDSPRALLPELQRYKDTVRCATLGA